MSPTVNICDRFYCDLTAGGDLKYYDGHCGKEIHCQLQCERDAHCKHKDKVNTCTHVNRESCIIFGSLANSSYITIYIAKYLGAHL